MREKKTNTVKGREQYDGDAFPFIWVFKVMLAISQIL